MDRERREPESIRRKKRRRRPRPIEDYDDRNLKKRRDLNKRRPIDDDRIVQRENDRRREEESLREERLLGKRKEPFEGESNLRKQKRKNKKDIKNIIISSIAVLLGIFLLSSIISIITFFAKIKNNTSVEAITPKGNEPVNILVLGMDIGNTKQVSNEGLKRTDTILLVNYNPNTKKTNVISIPRDTLISENGSNYKVNAAYVKGGDAKVKNAIENLLSVKINYVAKINYEAFRDFIDSIGGIKMKIEKDMIYDDNAQDLHINFKGGTTEQLDGKKAEEFFRWRKNNDGTGLAMGDLDRIKNQHKFIQQVIKKCTNPLIVFRMPMILSSIGSNIDTNMSAFRILKYLSKISIHSGGLSMVTLEGTPKTISGQSYFVFDKAKNTELINAIKTTEGTENASVNTQAKIMILNGTNTNGLAGQIKEKLISQGYSNIETGNSEKISKSVIQTDDSALKKSMKKVLGIKNIKSISENEKYKSYDVVITLGEDYKD